MKRYFLSFLIVLLLLSFSSCTNPTPQADEPNQVDELQAAINALGKTEKKIYNIVLEASKKFDKPESVRVESGTYDESVNFIANLRLSYENADNKQIQGFYTLLGSEGKVTTMVDLLKDADISALGTVDAIAACWQEHFDAQSINAALDAYWNAYNSRIA